MAEQLEVVDEGFETVNEGTSGIYGIDYNPAFNYEEDFTYNLAKDDSETGTDIQGISTGSDQNGFWAESAKIYQDQYNRFDYPSSGQTPIDYFGNTLGSDSAGAFDFSPSKAFTDAMTVDYNDPTFDILIANQKNNFDNNGDNDEGYFTKLAKDPKFVMSALALIWSAYESNASRKHNAAMLDRQEEFERSVLDDQQKAANELMLAKYGQELNLQKQRQEFEKSLKGGAVSTSGSGSVFAKKG